MQARSTAATDEHSRDDDSGPAAIDLEERHAADSPGSDDDTLYVVTLSRHTHAARSKYSAAPRWCRHARQRVDEPSAEDQDQDRIRITAMMNAWKMKAARQLMAEVVMRRSAAQRLAPR